MIEGVRTQISVDELSRQNAGRLQLELFLVVSRAAADLASIQQYMERHLTYLSRLETDGKLFLAGPLLDEHQATWSGDELMVLRAANHEEAQTLAENDPLHEAGLRTYTMRSWFVNEGGVTLNFRLSDLSLRLA